MSFVHVNLKGTAFLMFSIPSRFYIFFFFLLKKVSWALWIGIWWRNTLELNVSRSLTLYIFSGHESLFIYLYWRRKLLWWWLSMSLNYVYSRMSLRVILELPFLKSVFLVYRRSLTYLVTGPCLYKCFWIWISSHRVDLKSNLLLVDYSYRVCITITLAYLAG